MFKSTQSLENTVFITIFIALKGPELGLEILSILSILGLEAALEISMEALLETGLELALEISMESILEILSIYQYCQFHQYCQFYQYHCWHFLCLRCQYHTNQNKDPPPNCCAADPMAVKREG